MKKINELRVFDKNALFVYNLGKTSAHLGREVESIKYFPAEEDEGYPCIYQVSFTDGSYINHVPANVGGVFVSYEKEDE